MNFNCKVVLTGFIIFVFAASCRQKKGQPAFDESAIIHQNQKRLTEIIINDVFSPPVASRIYSYTSLAAHEAIRHAKPGEPSIVAKLKNFSPMPEPVKGLKYDFLLASNKAFFTVAYKVIFSKDSLRVYEEQLQNRFKENLDEEVFNRSLAFGESIGNKVSERLTKDNYKETRGMSKYIGSKSDGKWQPTAPDYLDATEPWWSLISPMTMDSALQFIPGPPPSYSKDSASEFYKMVKEVYDIGKNLSDEQRNIARYWDDNPFVMEHSGHLMFANKKITPGGHWMGIAAIACKKADADVIKTCRAYALTAIGLLDGFISCWYTKYFYSYVRPITLINQWFERKWEAFLQTPPFPEYTSGHSTISGSAATILTGLFGENFAFHDDADKEYIGMEKDFGSFMEAAREASLSRLYGGIHFRLSLDSGLRTGIRVGRHVLSVAN